MTHSRGGFLFFCIFFLYHLRLERNKASSESDFMKDRTTLVGGRLEGPQLPEPLAPAVCLSSCSLCVPRQRCWVPAKGRFCSENQLQRAVLSLRSHVFQSHVSRDLGKEGTETEPCSGLLVTAPLLPPSLRGRAPGRQTDSTDKGYFQRLPPLPVPGPRR